MNNLPSLPISPSDQEPEEAKRRAEIQILFGHASALNSLPAFQFFRTTVLQKLIDEKTEIALDRKKSAAERDLALELKDLLKEIDGWAKTTMETSADQLKD